MSSSNYYATDETQILPLHQFAPDIAAQPAHEGMTVFIKRAAEETLEQNGDAVVLPRDMGAIPAATLLGALTYCYASDVYESDRIERKLAANPKLKSAVGPELPPASAIRRFRKLNRSLILSVLEKAFSRRRATQAEKANAGEETIFVARTQAEQKLQLASLLDRSH